MPFFEAAISAIAVLSSFLVIRWMLRMRRTFELARQLPGDGGFPLLGRIISCIQCGFDPLKLLKLFDANEGLNKAWLLQKLFVFIVRPEYIQEFYTNSALNDRPPMYRGLEQILGDTGLVTSSGETWKKIRKMMVQTFHPVPQEWIISEMITQCQNMVGRLKPLVGSQFHEFEPILRTNNINLMIRIVLDEDGKDLPDISHVIREIDTHLKTVVLRIVSPLHAYDFTFNMTSEGRSFNKFIEVSRETVRNVILQKKRAVADMQASGKQPPNIYIYNLLTKYGNEPTDVLVSQILTTFGTGTDTSAGTLGFILVMLGIHLEWQEAVFQEDQLIQGRLSGRPLLPGDMQEYEVLERVVKETLRLYPAAPVIGRYTTAEVSIGKYTLPEGTSVFCIPFYVTRDEKNFENATKFDPDRFLPENIHKIHPYAYNPFSGGVRICAGMKFVMTFMKIVISTIVRNFKVVSEYRTVEEVDDQLSAYVTMKDKGKFKIRLELR